ncbi:MAG: copper chaperone PCu(A)C [Gammaproteobacteria bacterium]|nr:copper chaperone PCu(A)C [Gammaproteobacteria bacterium]
MIPRIFLLIPIVALSTSVSAQPYALGAISIERPWSRELPPVAPNGAAYFRVENGGSETVRIVSVSTPIADRAELHVHETDGGVRKMRHLHEVEVPAGGEVSFEPGGLHVMLIGLKPLVDGESFPLILGFDEAGTIEVTVDITRERLTDHSGHGEHEHGQSR